MAETSMTVESSQLLASASKFWTSVFQDGELGMISEDHFADRYRFQGEHMTVEQVRKWCRNEVDQYENRSMVVHDESFAAGNRVALYWTFQGTKAGNATTVHGMNLLRYDDAGRCVANWQVASPQQALDLRGS